MTDQRTGTAEDDEQTETRELRTSHVIDGSPERVYEAFLDPDELSQWMHPPSATCEVHHLEPDVEGTYRITMAGETPDGDEWGHTYGGRFEELVPGERIVQTEAPESEDSEETTEITVTITFDEVADGTEVTIVMSVPAGWPDAGIAGWDAALENLAARLGET